MNDTVASVQILICRGVYTANQFNSYMHVEKKKKKEEEVGMMGGGGGEKKERKGEGGGRDRPTINSNTTATESTVSKHDCAESNLFF